jgi:hypothetical protein
MLLVTKDPLAVLETNKNIYIYIGLVKQGAGVSWSFYVGFHLE